jgi:acyl-coenzyme A synthetase/AMP-(fatty) acid ligase
VVTPIGIEQRIEALDAVPAAAAVGIGPAGAQVVVAVVVPSSGAPRRGVALADADLADAVRTAAGVEVAAVLVTGRLPVDIRHQSKVDRREVARRAARVLAGVRSGHR